MKNKGVINAGDEFTLKENKRDIHFNKIGGLRVKVLEIHGRHNQFANVEIIVTGNKTTIVI